MEKRHPRKQNKRDSHSGQNRAFSALSLAVLWPISPLSPFAILDFFRGVMTGCLENACSMPSVSETRKCLLRLREKDNTNSIHITAAYVAKSRDEHFYEDHWIDHNNENASVSRRTSHCCCVYRLVGPSRNKPGPPRLLGLQPRPRSGVRALVRRVGRGWPHTPSSSELRCRGRTAV